MTGRAHRWSALAVLGAALVLLAACATGLPAGTDSRALSTEPAGGAAGDPAARVSGELVVLAATSLAAPFRELGEVFEGEHPGTTVRLVLGASSGHAAQITAGARGDVFAAASPETMAAAVDGLRSAGVAGAATLEPTVFATGSIALATTLRSPVTSLADLERPDVTFAVCDPRVPCGTLAARVLDDAGIDALPVTYERNAGAVLMRLRSGEVDAAFVYSSDLDEGIREVELPGPPATTRYPLLVLPEAPNRAAADSFVALVRSSHGQTILAEHGFGAP